MADDAATPGATDGGTATMIPISGLPYRFNPPIHPSLLHVNPDLTGGANNPRVTHYHSEGTIYEGGFDFRKMRLGRIVMGKEAMSFADVQKEGHRFGFRFLYNPNTVSGGMQTNASFIPDPSDNQTSILQEGLEVISFNVILNRTPEVIGGASTKDGYLPAVTEEDFRMIKKYGTHYDIEFLYRCANGVHKIKSKTEKTGDIGVLLPNPCELVLGPFRSRGALQAITAKDSVFSADMVPVMSEVQIQFSRFMTTVGAKWKTAPPETTGEPVGPVQGPEVYKPPQGPGYMSGREVYNVAVAAGFPAGEVATMMTDIAWAESTWRPGVVNSTNHVGLWQISDQHLKKLKLTSIDQLKDPATNARAAKFLYDGRPPGQKYVDWEVFTTGAYKKAPAW